MSPPRNLGEIAALAGGVVVGRPERPIIGLSTPDAPRPDALCIVWDRKLLDRLPVETPVLAPPGCLSGEREGVEAQDPRQILPRLLLAFAPPRPRRSGIDPSAVVDPSARIDPSAFIGPLSVVAGGAVIGADSTLEAQVFVGPDVVIGSECLIEPQVVLLAGTEIGCQVLIHSGVVIGCDGFGFLPGADGLPQKIPQIGKVVIEDQVEIGALCTVDRATIGVTRVGRGTKLDDHVHVGHNVQTGAGCLLVAFTGLAGSSTLGRGVTMAARSGTLPHVQVGDHATVAAQSGAAADVPPKTVVSGFPAQDHRSALRQEALVRRLPELFARVKALERQGG